MKYNNRLRALIDDLSDLYEDLSKDAYYEKDASRRSVLRQMEAHIMSARLRVQDAENKSRGID